MNLGWISLILLMALGWMELLMTNVRVQLESAVLGGVLRFPKVWDDLQLVADYFDDALNRLIFGRICELRNSGVVPDVMLVNAGLSSEQVLRVFECDGLAPFSGDAVVWHVNQLKAVWAKRKLEVAGATLLESAGDPSSNVGDLTAYALAEVDKVSASQAQLQISYPGDYLDDYVVEMASRPPFLATCWRRLNKLIGGFRNGGFYVVAGRPGQGKTIVALQSAFALAQSGRHVLYFSLEMPALQLQHRLLAQVLEIDYSRIANDDLDFEITDTSGGELREVWARDLVKSASSLLGNNLGVISSGRLTPNMVRAYVSAASKFRPVDAVFIDYLGLMSDDVAHKDKTERVGAISGALKQMALELDIPFVTAVQLNREVENRANDKPQLSDLRDSGSIEQDADVVLMIKRKHRPEENKDVGNGLDFFLVVAKNRHGQTGAAKFTAQDNLSRIVEQ
jgi:replicative DNA helicase